MNDPPNAKEIFADAIELTLVERAEFLRRACGGDAGLLAEVRQLVETHEAAGRFLDAPTIQSGAGLPGTVGEAPGSMIGRYRLLDRIGEGGFGVVFMAEQREPVLRRVALKIIKPGMDTALVIARFEAERQALAVMDHPNIAKVLDAGTTVSGRPYFVMELVPGRPITTYCDEHSLSIPERLGLFVQVCQAVQHAHIKGVIHRDINPRNVLASTQDGRPLARVIDFGIAKAVDRSFTERTVFTEQGQFIGTPEYMSPEQADGGLDIDTRTDVYSLGVLLYELLTGTTPLDPKRLRSAAFDELRRIIREVDPPRPSTRLSESKALSSLAADRSVDPGKLGTMLRGDLDWIVLKALDKDRSRRYDSPAGLAADLRRYMTGEAVEAAPPSSRYRVGKFVRRHRVGVIAGGLIGAALVSGLGVALWQADVAARERDAARQSAKNAVDAKNEALQRQKETEQVADFQASQLRGINAKQVGDELRRDLLGEAGAGAMRVGAGGAGERVAKLEEALAPLNFTNIALRTLDHIIFKRSLSAVGQEFADQPLVKAQLLQTLAIALRDVGLLEEAAAPQAEALEIRRRNLGDDRIETLVSVAESGVLMRRRGKLTEAEAYLREALERDRRLFGEDDEETITVTSNLADVLAAQGRLSDAETLFREVVARRRAVGKAPRAMLGSLNNLAYILGQQYKLSEAEPFAREAVGLCERDLGPENPTTIAALNTLATNLWSQNRFDDAEPLFRTALERARRSLGDDHPTTLALLFNRGSLLHNQGDLAGAEACYREVIDRFERVFTPGHPDTLMARRAIGRCSWKKRNGSMPRRTCASLPAVTRRIWAPRTTRR